MANNSSNKKIKLEIYLYVYTEPVCKEEQMYFDLYVNLDELNDILSFF